jgi:hypothetical protein
LSAGALAYEDEQFGKKLSALLVAVFQTGWQDFQDLQDGILIPLPVIFFYSVIFVFLTKKLCG